ncbi:histidine kinase [Hymenobacter sp. BT664]|uniref:Histidine kinase n=1 Tax=Hymenobacter montanus TaxID=2771359 RepID=A0A927GJN6_9BACT|nr:histidine kinase [Hymenobacter montanus]MBD2768683.1 histidine kinase [Hymenobacter montanus]
MESARPLALPAFSVPRPAAMGLLPPSLRWLQAPWAYHAAFWTVLYLFNTVYKGYLTKDYPYAFYDYSVRLPVYLVACYGNMYYLLPRLLPQRRYLAYAGALAGGLLVLTVLMQIMLNLLVNARLCPDDVCTAEYTTPLLFSPRNTLSQLFPVLTLVGLATGLKLGKNWVGQQQALQEVERLSLKNELNFLKSQIQPHFFFNTLNNLYSLTLKKSDLAPEIVLKLADLMSYVLYDADAPLVALAKEIECLRNYLALEGLRYGTRLHLAMNVTGEPAGKQLAPLLLLPFVENSFKHGAPPPQLLDIRIALEIEAEVLRLVVENPKNPAPPIGRNGGVGLRNVRRRLALLYPNAHQLTVADTADTYRITLEVPLA